MPTQINGLGAAAEPATFFCLTALRLFNLGVNFLCGHFRSDLETFCQERMRYLCGRHWGTARGGRDNVL